MTRNDFMSPFDGMIRKGWIETPTRMAEILIQRHGMEGAVRIAENRTEYYSRRYPRNAEHWAAILKVLGGMEA